MGVEEYEYYVNKLRQNVVWKHGYGVKMWRHKQHPPNTNDHHMQLHEIPLMKIFCVRHCRIGWQLIWNERWNRTVARKFSIGGLCVSAGGFKSVHGGAWYSKNGQKLNWFILFHVSIWVGLEFWLEELSPQKPPHGVGTALKLFRTMPQVGLWLLDKDDFLLAGKVMGNHWCNG